MHSQDMADNGYFSHYSQDGRSPWDRAEALGIVANGENIAAGRESAEAVLTQWKNSDGHCRNMGNPSSKLFAVGYAGPQGPYRHYWTQLFKTAEVKLDTSCYPSEADATTTVALTTTSTTTSAPSGTTSTLTSAPLPVQAGDTIWLRAHTGKYLTVQGTEVHAQWNNRHSWEAFVIEKESSNQVNVQSGDTIYLRAHTGRLVTAQGTMIHAKWNHTGSWERFVIEKKDADGSIYPNDTIYLRAHTGKRVSVEGTTVHAKWENQGSWEALRLES